VAASLAPTNDSDIKIEVWLPTTNWNQKFQAVGNGGFSGSINYAAMTAAIGRGYATASTDTGHSGATAGFAPGHPEKVIDFGWRSVHEMTVVSKRLIAAFYEQTPRLSYWTGCSAGGRQALKEAQRFPADFDGIVAGSPGLDWTGRAAGALRMAQRLRKNEAARLSQSQVRLLHAAVLQACDARDGATDDVIDDPRHCAFDPGVLQCRGTADDSCLTPPQVETARMMYAAQINRNTRREIPALYRGSELGWTETGWSARRRSGWISSAISCSRIPGGILRFSISIATFPARKRPTRTPSTRSIPISDRSSIAAGS
jgi:feruloyl esterase